MSVNFDYYRVFYFVAKHKSFTKAANELFVAQPNVTRTIKGLEEQLGCVLFSRSGKRVELTPEGEKLYAHVKIAYENILLGEEQLLADKSLQGGVVAVGTGEIALYGLLLPVLKNFRARYRGIKLKVGNYSTRQSIAALNDGLVDFAVVTSPLNASEKLKITRLKTFREIAVGGDAFADLARAPVSLSDVAQCPVVGLARSSVTYDFYAAQFAKYGLKYNPEIEVATADQILPMVKNDIGVGFVPAFFLSEDDGVHRFALKEDVPAREICLVERTDRPLSLAAKKLKSEILARCTEQE